MLLLLLTSMILGINQHPFLTTESALQPEGLLHTRGMAASGLRPLCNIPTAASRRSLGRVSVPVWLIFLSEQLEIVALVSLYPTNQLISLGPLFAREPKPTLVRRHHAVLAVVSNCYPPRKGKFPSITHPSATRQQISKLIPVTVRLACVRPAASVQSEP